MRYLNLVLPGLCLYLATAAFAQTVKQVDCSKGKSITAAVDNLKSDEDYIIEVSGVCTENVVVRNFEGTSLQIIGTPTATISGLAVSPPVPAFQVSSSRSVRIANFTVNPVLNPTPGPLTGNSGGATLSLCRGCVVDNVTVNHDRLGVLWLSSQGSFSNSTVNLSGTGTATAIANSSDVTVANYQAVGNASPLSFAGLNVDAGSRVRLTYNVAKQIKNFITGIRVANASSVEGGGACLPSFSVCLEVRDNTYGMRMTSAQGTVMSGVTFADNGAGVWVENGSIATLGPVVNITGSTGVGGSAGNGLTVTHNSHAAISSLTPPGAGNNITGNVRRGISVASGSSVQLNGLDSANANNVTGNLSPDIACDATSLITGVNTLPPATILVCASSDPAPIPLP